MAINFCEKKNEWKIITEIRLLSDASDYWKKFMKYVFIIN